MDERQPEYGNKRDYIDRAYEETSGEIQHLYLYLIDRMQPDKSKEGYQHVLPGFFSVFRMHKDTGMHEDTINWVLEALQSAGLIYVFRHEKKVNEWRKKEGAARPGIRRIIDSIRIAPPGQIVKRK